VIDENVSEGLIGQAFKVIFKEFERYIKIMKMFKGIDWNIYVKMRNKERKAGDAKKDEENKDGGEEEGKEEEDIEEKEKQEAIKKQEERAEREMKSIYKLYSESFLRRLLRLVEIFTSIATTSPYPLSMVQRVANPY